MQVLVNRGGVRPIATTLPSTRFPTTHRATRGAKPNKTTGRVASGRSKKESTTMATATYLPIKRNVVTSKSRKGKSFKVPVHNAKRTTATKKRGQFVRDARRSNLPLQVRRGAGGRFVKTGGVLLAKGAPKAWHMTGFATKPAGRKTVKSKSTKKKGGKRASPRRSNKGSRKKLHGAALIAHQARLAGVPSGGGRFTPATKIRYRTNQVLVHRTRHMRNPVGFDGADHLASMGTWGKVGVGVLFGIAGLIVAFGIPKGLAMITGYDAFQRGWGGVATAAVVSLGVGFGVSLLSKHASLGLLTAAGVGVAILAINALSPSVAQMVIPLNEATLAAMLPTFDSSTTSSSSSTAPSAQQLLQVANAPVAPGMSTNAFGLPLGMAPAPAGTPAPAGMGMAFYPAAPGMGYYPVVPAGRKPSYYPAGMGGVPNYSPNYMPPGMGGYNPPAPGAVSTPNATTYVAAASAAGGPQGYNPPVAGVPSTADLNIRYSATTKEKF